MLLRIAYFLITRSAWYSVIDFNEGNDATQDKGNVFRSNTPNSKNGETVRKEFTEYFNNEGKI